MYREAFDARQASSVEGLVTTCSAGGVFIEALVTTTGMGAQFTPEGVGLCTCESPGQL